MLRAVRPDDASAIAAIYNRYIAASPATFEETPTTTDEMLRRILDITSYLPWLVCEEQGALRGYAYAAKWKDRSAYRFTVEASVYLDPAWTGKRVGSALLGALLEELRTRGLHSVIGGISLPNAASVALVERFGFRQVSLFKDAGYKFGKWVDVGHWQLML
jgi:L-amino acid N-acyltransferase YncA